LLAVAENSSGEFKRADDAEDALAEGIRQMGMELLQTWATGQNAITEENAKENAKLRCHTKKSVLAINIWSNRSSRTNFSRFENRCKS